MAGELSRRDALKLAAESELDVRTVKRAMDRGLSSLRAEVDRERLRAAAARLGLEVRD
jgi:hypothetical protein